MTVHTLYLASSSPRRRQLLKRAGIPFSLHVVPIDEDALSEQYEGPLNLLGEFLARRKALAAFDDLRSRGQSGIVLASDTTVLLDGRSLAKPHDEEEAAFMLRKLRGREHIVGTGVALVGPEPDALASAHSLTRVRMREYSDDEIAHYISTGDPFDKAGGYSIQHPEFQPVQSFNGCHTGIIGLPLCIVRALLGKCTAPDNTPQRHSGQAVCAWSRLCTQPFPAAGCLSSASAREVTD